VEAANVPADTGNIAEIATAFIAALGFFFAILELHRSTRNQRAQFLLDTTHRYFGDENVRKLYYELDYRTIVIEFKEGQPNKIYRKEEPPHPFIPSEVERHLDALLYALDTIGRVFELGTLTSREAKIFSFQARRVMSHPSVDEYVQWITRERARFGGEAPAFLGAYVLAELIGSVKVDQQLPDWFEAAKRSERESRREKEEKSSRESN
jgi:hypothetical protein